MPLYSEKTPLWIEHPTLGAGVDVVAIPVDSLDRSQFVISTLTQQDHVPADMHVTVGADVQVIGYPLGFHDKIHNLPIVRNATLASIYPVPFQGDPYVLIDARLHRGTSGSPVMTQPSQTYPSTRGNTRLASTAVSYLLGIQSATLDSTVRDLKRDEPLGLSVVWFAHLITEMLS